MALRPAALSLRLGFPAADGVDVSAPEINHVFSRSGSMIANDTVASVILAGTKGEGFLQSRSGTPGEPGKFPRLNSNPALTQNNPDDASMILSPRSFQ